MATYRRYARKTRTRWTGKRSRSSQRVTGFAATPAGKHRKLGALLLRLARRAKAIGNRSHAAAMSKLGRRALALSRTEVRLWRQGKALQKRSYATNRALRAW